MSDAPGEITRLLAEAHEGRTGALDQVMSLVYDDLCRIADRKLHGRYGGERVRNSLEPTDLVNEAFLKLVKQRKRYDSRGHFFAIATRMMLRVLLDHHRKKRRAKRGVAPLRVTLSKVEEQLAQEPGFEIPTFVETLEIFEQLAPRSAEVVKLRLVWGLTVAEIATALDLSVSTVEREWRFARRWLSAELRQAGSGERSSE